jgi:hypothetical protein
MKILMLFHDYDMIYCPSDIKQKRTTTVYRNVTQYNNKQKHSHDSVTNSNIWYINRGNDTVHIIALSNHNQEY